MLKKVMPLLVLLTVSITASSQTVKTSKESAGIRSESLEGYSIEVEGKVSEVTSLFVKYLKPLGKVKQGDDLTVPEPTIQGIKYNANLYGQCKDRDKKVKVWLGIDARSLSKEQSANVNKEIEKMLHEFGVQYYRGKIQVQVDESTRAAQAIDKQQQKLVNEEKALATRLEDNKREKTQLEKSLQNNKIENDQLLKKIEKNKHDQDSVAQASKQVKKIVDLHKEKQRKVN